MARIVCVWVVFAVTVIGASDALICHCNETHAHAKPGCYDNNYTCTTELSCFTQKILVYGEGFIRTRWGCNEESEFLEDGHASFLCGEKITTDVHKVSWLCCNDSDRCNRWRFLELPFSGSTPAHLSTTASAPQASSTSDLRVSNAPQSSNDMDQPLYLGLAIGVPIICVTVVTLLVTVLVLVYLRRRKKRRDLRPRRSSPDEKELSPLGYPLGAAGSFNDLTCTSGSGAGTTWLIQRTIARSIQIGDSIGSGRYGQVYIGRYQGEKVAVKKFTSWDEKSWFREAEIYRTVLLRHENILGFFASDMVSNNGVTELWLITEYHAHGSLYDYLHVKAISQETMLKMSMSICSGLSHLHTELFGTQSKPAMAHRDMKSKNILVKSNLTCCIADFGLAVIKESVNTVNVPANPKQGTKRYMSPEILSEAINMLNFESFKQADVYAVGLVLWELCKLCRSSAATGVDQEPCYELPFQGLVPPDPSFEDMRRLVVIERRQPTIPNWWHQDELLREMTKMMRECWYFNSSARPTAVYLKKKLLRIYEEEKMSYSDHE